MESSFAWRYTDDCEEKFQFRLKQDIRIGLRLLHFMRRRILLYLLVVLSSIAEVSFSCAAEDPGRVGNLDSFLSIRAQKESFLSSIYVEWDQNLDLSEGFREDAIALKRVFVSTKCRMAAKGSWRFYDVHYSPLAGFDLDERDQRKAMSFNGDETRILMYTDHARIFSGNKTHSFGAPDDYLALQMYPASEFSINHAGSKYSCELGHIAKDREYEFAMNHEDPSSPAIVSLQGPGDILRFDASLGYAIVSREIQNSDGSRALYYTFEDHEAVGEGVWLARSIKCQTYQGEEVIQTSTLTVAKVEHDRIPDRLFLLEFLPETMISDMRHFPADADGTTPIVNYKVPTEPGELDRVAQAAREKVSRTRSASLESSPSSTLKSFLFYANIVAIVLILLILWRSKKSNV